jgi:hypothetical protein
MEEEEALVSFAQRERERFSFVGEGDEAEGERRRACVYGLAG